MPSYEIQADVLRFLKAFDEPLGESVTKRREKYQPVCQRNTPNNIFIVKLENFTPGVEMLELKTNRKKSRKK